MSLGNNSVLLIGVLVAVLIVLLLLLVVLNRRSAAKKNVPSIPDEPVAFAALPPIDAQNTHGDGTMTPAQTDAAPTLPALAASFADAGSATPASTASDDDWFKPPAGESSWYGTPTETAAPAENETPAEIAAPAETEAPELAAPAEIAAPETEVPAEIAPPAEIAAAEVDEPTVAAVVTQAPPAEEPPPANASPPVAERSPAPARHPSPAGRSDPVRIAILSLLESPGELTQPETRRLELYRPERVLAIVDELEPAHGLKGKEQARARLARIRKYALEFQEDLSAAGTAAVVAGAVAATEGSPAVKDNGASDHQQPTQSVAAEEWPPDAVETIDDDLTAETPGAATQTPPDAHALYAVPAYVDDPASIPDEHTSPAATDDTAPAWVEAPVGAQERVENVVAEEPAASDPLQSLQVDISTAEDLLALDRSERIDALAFLGTEQLGRTFALADEPQLKRAAIDMLEQEGSSEALSAIQTCFEDTDPELQLYAVDAAERLLTQMDGR